MDNQAILHKCRPCTATLTKPQILDPSWSTNIDMTKIRLATLAQVESIIKKPMKALHFHITEDSLLKYQKGFFDINTAKRTKRSTPGPLITDRLKLDAMDIIGDELTSQVPSPCRTCTKNDEPERFHSHPKGAARKTFTRDKLQTTRNTVTKPVALKYKSGKTREPLKFQEQSSVKILTTVRQKPGLNIPPPLHARTPFLAIEDQSRSKLLEGPSPKKTAKSHIRVIDGNIRHNDKIDRQKFQNDVPMLTAYEEGQYFCKRCGKTFGTDEQKYNDHSEMCMNEWDDVPVSLDDEKGGPTWELVTEEDKYYMYNTLLKPCPICKRKFFPNRLETHEAACRKFNRQ